ncbi:hypothetical protein Q5752_000493 [Cryptotrichosporon argae]
MFEFIVTVLLAMLIMACMMCLTVGLTMPFYGSLVRLRANYNPHAVGLDGTDNRVGPRLTTLFGTMKRTKRLEGWYGLYKGVIPMMISMTLVSLASVIFVGGSATRGPKGGYTVPAEGGIRMALFTIVLTLISLPCTIIINRAIITPYRLPMNARESAAVLLSPAELARPYLLYLTPGLLAATFAHSFASTLIARSVRSLLLGTTDAEELFLVSNWRIVLFVVWQGLATLWLTPLEVVATKLSVQPNLGSEVSVEDPDAGAPEGLRFAGTDEDVVGLRPTTEPYSGFVDAVRKIIDEEGWDTLYRGWWWTALSAVAAIFS